MTTRIMILLMFAASSTASAGLRRDVIADAVGGLMRSEQSLRTPMFQLATGVTSEGAMLGAAAGFAWGTHNSGLLLPGATLKRVMFGVRGNLEDAAARGTIGVYTNALGVLGADVGIEAQLSGDRAVYPILQMLIGYRGIAVRTSLGVADFWAPPDMTWKAAVELVLELSDLGKRL